MKTPLMRGTICRIASQCIDPETGNTGTWLFSGQDHREKDSRRTPLFPDFYSLCRWIHDECPGTFTQVGAGQPLAYVFNGTLAEKGARIENHMAETYPNVI